jgi:hypothetical protein
LGGMLQYGRLFFLQYFEIIVDSHAVVR